jgi:hypothetical protein
MVDVVRFGKAARFHAATARRMNETTFADIDSYVRDTALVRVLEEHQIARTYLRFIYRRPFVILLGGGTRHLLSLFGHQVQNEAGAVERAATDRTAHIGRSAIRKGGTHQTVAENVLDFRHRFERRTRRRAVSQRDAGR